MKMKKSLSVFLTVIAFLTVSCSNWMKDDDFYNKIDYDVKVANAASVSAYVRFANSKMGTTDPSGSIVLKEDIPTELIAVTNDDYGFVKWAAFSTKDFPTNKQHSDLFYESAEKYAKDFKSLELPASEVSFSDPKNLTTTVTINTTRSDIFITPLVAKRPAVVTSVPSNGRADVVKNSQVRILFSKPIDEKSLKDEFGNSNIVVTSGSAVLTESSSELGAKDITEYFDFTLSKTKKMLTISAKRDENNKPVYIFDSNSQISINIYEDVCDTDGYNMNGKMSFAFTTGTKQDSLAPYIEKLSAGIGEDCLSFAQYTGGKTERAEFEAAAEAATNDLDNYKNTPILAQRVKDKVNIYVKAVDIAGSGGNVIPNQDNQSESDVALIQIRATQYINASGAAVTTSKDAFPNFSTGSNTTTTREVEDVGYAMGVMDANCQIKTKTFEQIIDTGDGTIFTYDLKELADGLIKIDVWAVDMVGNSGDTEIYKSTYGNGYRSIFVVKDKTAPDAAAAKSKVQITSQNTPYSWFNSAALSNMKIQDTTTNLIKDLNSEYLSSDYKKLEWAFKLGNDTSWQPSPDAANTWKPIHKDNGQPEIMSMSNATVSSDGPVYITMCLKDDLGNVSAPVVLDAINYDNTAPAVSTVSWVKQIINNQTITYENTVASTNESDLGTNHILKIPFTEEWSGIRRMTVTVNKRKNDGTYQTTAVDDQTGYSVRYVPASGSARDISFVSGSINAPTVFNVDDSNKVTTGTLYIKGIKIGSETGTYRVTVDLWDSALNQKTITSEISIDKTDPVVKKLYIPNLKHSITATASGISTDSKDGWFLPREYIHGPNGTSKTSSQKPGFIPLYIFVEEKDSGIRVIEFESSDDNVMLFTSAGTYNGKTKLYWGPSKDNVTEIPESDYTITYSTNPVTKTITFNDDKTLKAASDFVILVENIGFDNYRVGENKIKVKVHDLAARSSASENKITTVADSDDENDKITGVKSDSYFKVSENIYTLVDRGANGTSIAAEAGFTNEDLINLDITFKNENSTASADSGYNKIKLDGAKFTGTTAVKIGNQPIDYELSTDKTEITFIEKNQQGNPTGTYVVLRTDSSITISDIKLDSNTEEEHKVKIQAYDLTGWGGDLTPAETKITVDTTAPVWIGKGLYTGEYGNSNYVYPHPKADMSSEGLTLPGRSDLYFYRSSSIRINAKFNDDNPREDSYKNPLVRWSGGNISGTTVDDDYINGGLEGDFTANIYDKAGNKSEEKAFHIQYVGSLVITDDNSRKDIKTNLENEVTLVAPQGADLEKNTFLNGVRSDVAYTQNSRIWTFNYVLKPFSGNYKLTIPVSSYAAATEKSAPIEKYILTVQYKCYPSEYQEEGVYLCRNDPFIPRTPGDNNWNWNNYEEGDWHDYTKNSSSKTDDGLESYVDANGDIIITLPNSDTRPISLWLKDGCGNTEYIILNPGLKNKIGTLTTCQDTRYETTDEKWGKRNQAVSYVFDNRVGVSDSNNGSGTYEVKDYPSGSLISKSDITFYKKLNDQILNLQLKNLSDTCRFPRVIAQGQTQYNGVADLVTDSEKNNYTLKSKIIVWQGIGEPTYGKFYDENISGSAWYGWKEFFEVGAGSSAFILKNNCPEFDNLTHDTSKFELWYIIEDRVGNFEIRQIKNGNTTDWLYDVTPPVLDVKTANNVNNIDNKNYYSDSSSVLYSIVDKQSGIQNNGDENNPISGYSGFNSRVQLYPETGYTDYQLNGVKPKDSNGTPVNNGIPGTIAISGVKDWAENSVDSVGLSNGGSTTWVKLGTPTLSGIMASFTPVPFDTENNVKEGDLNLSSNNNVYTLKPKINVSKIQITIPCDSSNNIMGYIVRSSEADLTGNFYTQSDVETEYIIQKKNNNGSEVNDEKTSWSALKLYLYPVNKAGLATSSPITIDIIEDPVPAITSGVNSKDNYEVTTSTDTNIVNAKYLNPSSTIAFKSDTSITKFTIYTKRKNGTLIKEYSTSGTTHTITFNDQDAWSGKSNQGLYLQLDTGTQTSVVYKLIIGGDNNTTWTYDKDAPTINTPTVSDNTTIITGDATYYVTDLNNTSVTITVTASDGTNGTGILKYQMAKGSSDSSAFTTDSTSGTFTITATDTKENYYFRAMDKAGNVSTVKGPYAIQKDTTAPAVTEITASPMNGASAAGTSYYHKETSSTTTNIYYNNSNVTSIHIAVTGASDGGSGLPTKYLSYKTAATESALSSATPVDITGSYVDFSLGVEKKVYQIIIKDKLENSKVLGTYILNGEKPTGTVSYTAVDGTSITGSTIYFRSTGTNPISSIALNVADVKDSQGAAASLYYTTDSSSTHETLTVSNGKITIPCPTNASKTETYHIYASDSLGNTTELKTYTLNGAVPAGTVSYTAVDGTFKDGYTIYFRSTGSNPVTSINLTSTVINADGTYSSLWYQIGDASLVQMTGTTLPCPDNENKEATYKIFAKDSLGNISAELAEFTLKGAAPTGSITSYEVKKGDNNATAATATASGDYILSSSGTTDSITYHPARVNKITVNMSAITDNGMGAKVYVNDGNTITSHTESSFDITLGNDWTEAKTYTVFIKDGVGNETPLKTFVFKAHGSAPVVNEKKHPYYSGLQYVPTYPHVDNPNAQSNGNWTYKDNWIQAFKQDGNAYKITSGSTTIIKELEGFTGEKPKIFGYNSDGEPTDGNTANTTPDGFEIVQLNPANGVVKFNLPVYSLPSNNLYYSITYNSIVPPTEWTRTTVTTENGKQYIANIPIDLTDSAWSRHTIIFVWYKDELGNISVHNLTDPNDSNSNRNWFTTASAKGDNGDVSDFADFQYTETQQSGTNPNVISTSAFSGLIDTSKFAGARDLAATQISAAQSSGIKLNKDIDSGSVADGLVKNAKVSKKAAKAAKAAAKATAKAAKEAPSVQEIELQDAFVDSVVNENIPISEQIIKDDIYQITAKTEFVMGGIEPGETNESIVSAIAQEENSSSKTALWIVLCALCAAAAGLVVCLKKKRG